MSVYSSRRARGGKVKFLTVVLLLVLSVGGFLTYLFLPYYVDYWHMKEAVKSSALSWYAEDEENAAHESMRISLKDKGIDYITNEDCEWEKRGDYFTVSCGWIVDVYYPGTNYYKTIEYVVSAEADQRGDVVVY